MNEELKIYKYKFPYLLLAAIAVWIVLILLTYIYSIFSLPFGGTIPHFDLISFGVVLLMSIFISFQLKKARIIIISPDKITSMGISINLNEVTKFKLITKIFDLVLVIEGPDPKKTIIVILPFMLENYSNLVKFCKERFSSI